MLSKSRHPQFLILRILASKIEHGLLTSDEAQVIASIFRRIAEGERADDLFGGRPTNRPVKHQTLYYVDQVFGLTQLSHNGLPGLKVKDAIQQVASRANVSPDTVKAAIYSKHGREFWKSYKFAENILNKPKRSKGKRVGQV